MAYVAFTAGLLYECIKISGRCNFLSLLLHLSSAVSISRGLPIPSLPFRRPHPTRLHPQYSTSPPTCELTRRLSNRQATLPPAHHPPAKLPLFPHTGSPARAILELSFVEKLGRETATKSGSTNANVRRIIPAGPKRRPLYGHRFF